MCDPLPDRIYARPRIIQLFWVWFTSNFNILAFGTGSAGPAFFGLGLKHSLVILLILMRIPSLLFSDQSSECEAWYNVDFLGDGWLVVNGIIGAQTIAAVSSKLDDTLGIVILGAISLVVTFCGYRVLHWFETYAWIPNLIAFPTLLGLGGRHLNPSTFISVSSPTASAMLSFASFVASNMISWSPSTPDYGVYHDANVSERKIFIWIYLGFFLSSHHPSAYISPPSHRQPWLMLGAIFAAAAPCVPDWQAGFEEGSNVGGLIVAVLAPAKGFGKFLAVMLALSTSGFSWSERHGFRSHFCPRASIHAGRCLDSDIYSLAIVGAKRFYSTLVDILSVIGYWSSIFTFIVLAEHFVFRRRWAAYDVAQWNKAAGLPTGIAAVLAFLCGFGIIVPCMKQTWYTGPIAHAGTGDIGIFTGGIVGVLVYIPLRAVERRLRPGR
ncbi:cytosine-purine permease [Pholiota molesta]|nr:cytosine-purine permease [Pholiota molesta]